MDVQAILKQLREEREQVEEAIIALERMLISQGHRRGRPPAWLSVGRKAESAPEPNTPKRGRSRKSPAHSGE